MTLQKFAVDRKMREIISIIIPKDYIICNLYLRLALHSRLESIIATSCLGMHLTLLFKVTMLIARTDSITLKCSAMLHKRVTNKMWQQCLKYD